MRAIADERKAERMLDAAEVLYSDPRRINEHLAVRRLAKEGDTTSQTVYTYFGSRDMVVASMTARAVNLTREWLAATVAGLGAGTDRRVEFLVAWHAWCVEFPARWKLVRDGEGPALLFPSTVTDGGYPEPRADAAAVSLAADAQLALRNLIPEVVRVFVEDVAGVAWSDELDGRARQMLAMVAGLATASRGGFCAPEADPVLIGRLCGVEV